MMEGRWCIEYNTLARKHTLVTMSTTVLSHIHTHTHSATYKKKISALEKVLYNIYINF